MAQISLRNNNRKQKDLRVGVKKIKLYPPIFNEAMMITQSQNNTNFSHTNHTQSQEVEQRQYKHHIKSLDVVL